MKPYPFQQAAIEYAFEWSTTARPGDRLLIASPTGTGKSVMELHLQSLLGATIVTPKVEIIDGMVAKGADRSKCSTPITLRNRLLEGSVDPPSLLIFDEVHHHSAESWKQIDALCGMCPSIGFTATPYRGTPKGTAEFREAWGEALWAITLPEAVANGYLSFPVCRVVPILDDDTVNVVNGEFQLSDVEERTIDAFEEIAKLCYFDRPTMVAMPGTKSAAELTRYLESNGIPAVCVVGETSAEDRRAAFDACISRTAILVQVQVVSEGVDLPIRRLIDCSPMMSPVRWVQQLGRITRPTDVAPEYICTNRNLLRHAYLLEGVLPTSAVLAAQDAFPGSKRQGIRVVGLEGLGRFKGSEVPLASGLKALSYSLSRVDGHHVTEYFALTVPTSPDVLWAKKIDVRESDGQRTYGTWQRCEAPNGVEGFASLAPRDLSDKQRAWWARQAGRFGLDANAKVNRKTFPVLPVLSSLGMRIG